MKARVKWVDGAMMVGESGSGHAIVMDGAPEFGGRDMGVRPMEMLLLGLGGCTEFDVVHILKKGRNTIAACEVEIEAQRATTDPKVFTSIHVHFKVSGPGLTDKVVARAVKLSAEKFCSASLMLSKAAEITHDYEVIDTLLPEESTLNQP
jgi:putative redox protein